MKHLERRTKELKASLPTIEILEMVTSCTSIEDVDLMVSYITKTPNKEEDPNKSTAYHTFSPEESRLISEAVNKRIEEVSIEVRAALLNFLTWLKPPEIRPLVVVRGQQEDNDD